MLERSIALERIDSLGRSMARADIHPSSYRRLTRCAVCHNSAIRNFREHHREGRTDVATAGDTAPFTAIGSGGPDVTEDMLSDVHDAGGSRVFAVPESRLRAVTLRNVDWHDHRSNRRGTSRRDGECHQRADGRPADGDD